MKMTWTKEAEELISKAPIFIRPMARGKIEKIAKGKAPKNRSRIISVLFTKKE